MRAFDMIASHTHNNSITVDHARSALAQSVGGESALASSFSARTMGDLAKRAARELDDAASAAIDMLNRVHATIDREGLANWHRTSDSDLLARYVRFWAAYQAAGARVMNWMVTGPARFPVARNEKRMDAEHRRWTEYDAFRKQAPERAVNRAQRVRKAEIGAVGLMDSELSDLRQRHDERARKQSMMRTINALIRKHNLTEVGDGPAKLAALSREANHPIGEAAALAILTPNYMGQRGFAGYQLSNNNAEIKRLAGRIQSVERKAQRGAAVEAGEAENPSRVVAGVQIVENAAEDRLQLIFPDRPSPEIRALLKARAFKWSPRNGAWQRQLTNNARYAVEGIVAKLEA